MTLKVVLSYDIGGTNSRVWLVDGTTGKMLDKRVFPTKPSAYKEALDEIESAGRELLSASNNYDLVAIGVGVAGAVKDGVIIGSGNLFGWIDKNFGDDLATIFHVPVIILNDCGAAALGEFTVFKRSLIYVIWGTGVGVAVIVADDKGEITFIRETELSHIVIDLRSKIKCGCGGRGHFEALVSGANIPKRFRRWGFLRRLKAEELNDRQWRKVLKAMAIGLRNLSASDMGLPIVMGGGVSCKQAQRLPLLQKVVEVLPSTAPVPELLLAQCGEDAGLIGAAYAARKLVGL